MIYGSFIKMEQIWNKNKKRASSSLVTQDYGAFRMLKTGRYEKNILRKSRYNRFFLIEIVFGKK